MLSISLLAIILYGANKYYHFAPYLTFHGLVRCICFFFMGNVFRQKNIMIETNVRKDLTIGSLTLAISLLLFYWHIHEKQFVLHIVLYYVVNLLSVFAIIYLFRCLNNIKSYLVFYISIGTMAIFGLHRLLLGCINFGFERLLHQNDIVYKWYTSLLIALAITVILLPLIIYAKRHCPILLGKKKS